MNQVTTEVKTEPVINQGNVELTPPVQEKVETPVEVSEPENEKDINWKKFKAARAKEREEAEAMARKAQEKEAEANALKAAMDAILNKPQGNRNGIRDSEYRSYDSGEQLEESEEQRIERKVNEQLAKREAEFDRKRQEQEQQDFPKRLVANNADFNQVCSTENLDYLEYHYPEVAAAFAKLPDNYDKWNNIYKAVKRFVPNTDTRKDQAKMEKNLAKPGSISAPGTTQGGNAMPGARLDAERRAANWERMQRVIKGLS